jgi:RecJ-like exonuclease
MAQNGKTIMTEDTSKRMNPGDEVALGSPGSGEDICPECRGTGKVRGATCANCGGTGKITRAIGGA